MGSGARARQRLTPAAPAGTLHHRHLPEKIMRRTTATIILGACLAQSAAAQSEHHHGTAEPRSGHVRFPTTCAPSAQPDFERGVTLMHSFWYEEAGAAFRAAATADTTCALAQWGVAMSYLHPLWAAPTA